MNRPLQFCLILNYGVAMLRAICKTVSLFLLIFVFSGCTHTTTTGRKLAELDSPVKKLSYAFNTGQSSNSGIGSLSINETITDLTKQLSTRMPLLFSLNGIETATPDVSQYHLVVFPFHATYVQYGGHVGIDMRATLIDKKQLGRKIWEGNIHFHRPGLSSVDEKAADTFAQSVLAKLVSDDIVRLESSEIKMPQEKAK